jgi:hypothetical protein
MESPNQNSVLKNLLGLALLTILAFLIMGYHPGLEDDAFYLAAIKHNLNPNLFPHDADFFRVQFQATIFDKLIAWSVRLSHIPLAWGALFWQLGAIFLLLHGSWQIARRCFVEPGAQWSAVSLVAALLTLPVSGTGITLADQYLHPRTLATAAILAAIVAVIDRRFWIAALLLAVAFAIHAIMASFGISFCAFLAWTLHSGYVRSRTARPIAAVMLLPVGAFAFVKGHFHGPFSWIFEPSSDAWRRAAATRSFYFLTRWEWYEWLGIFAPLVLLVSLRYFGLSEFFQRYARSESGIPPRSNSADHHSTALVPLLSALIYYGVFQTVVGLLVMLPPSLERLRPFEPMRYLHLLYLVMFLSFGGLIGGWFARKVSQSPSAFFRRPMIPVLLFFVLVAAGMSYAQLQMFPATSHLELPGVAPGNAWVQAFGWIRQNTPVDSLFALDPHYVELPGEDYHGFRALAERSALADYVKDGGMAARVPRLAPRWLKEVEAQSGWPNFQAADFARLKKEFGVNWVIISDSAAAQRLESMGMTCIYQNSRVQVCRLQ